MSSATALHEDENKVSPGQVDGELVVDSLLARYARQDGDKLIITLPHADVHNLGLLLVKAIFGYLLALQKPNSPDSSHSVSGAQQVALETSTSV